jgi:hypothetical protein
MYPTIPSIITGIVRGTAELPNRECIIDIQIMRVMVKVTLTKMDSMTGKRIASAYTVIHAPEYPEGFNETGGYERAQRLIQQVNNIAALKRVA